MSASNDSSVNAQNPYQHKIFTVPNLLSTFRLALIPVFIWLYCFRREYGWTAFVLILSGLTDIVDGFIARHFHMISDLGKMLDPVADKLTQGAMLFCLMTAFPFMMIPLILLVVKETIAAVTGLIIIKKTKQVYGAVWHGKVTTGLLYATMIVHVIWYQIPPLFSNLLIALCVGMMSLSLVLYLIRNIKLLKEAKAAQ